MLNMDILYQRIKNEIKETIKEKNIPIVELAEKLNYTMEEFDQLFRNQDKDFSLYLDILHQVTIWEDD